MASENDIRSSRSEKSSVLRASRYWRNSEDINILLIGPTGVGKTTFINALINYMIHDSLDDAVRGEMQVLIPAAFTYVDNDTYEDKMITIGDPDKYEQFSNKGQSATQLCRSYIFPVANRRLRIIDTPGVGDTRGLEKDKENFQEILAFIAQFDHLNAICMLLKPNEDRLTIPFQYCVNELVRHLHKDAKENLVFIFTNARQASFRPGATIRVLRALFEDNQRKYNTEVRIERNNTFIFDSEPFRCLALLKHKIKLDEDLSQTYQKSWDHSVTECSRLLSHIVTLPFHRVRHTISLNEAEQLILKLPRPLAETQRLLEENIQLAERFKDQVDENPELMDGGMPQNLGSVRTLDHPRTVCTSDQCRRVIEINGEKRIEYISICHDECYLAGVKQETLEHPKIQDCSAIDFKTDHCTECGCYWRKHIHITYEYLSDRTRVKFSNSQSSSSTDPDSIHQKINQRIEDLREEVAKIQDVYRQLAEFLHANAMLPFNDAFIDYLQYFIQEERTKQTSDRANAGIIARLEEIKSDFRKHIETFKESLKEINADDRPRRSSLKSDDVFNLVKTLYDLPITGAQIREQVRGIEILQDKTILQKEHYVTLPAETASSKVMQALTNIIME